MEEIPIAEEFLNENVDGNCIYDDLLKHRGDVFYEDDVKKAMIEFAKLHVEAALNFASLVKTHGLLVVPMFNDEQQKAILNSYSLENIK